jgi:DNA-binding transcriptional MerR regulator
MIYTPEEFCEEFELTTESLAVLRKEGIVPFRVRLDGKMYELYDTSDVLALHWIRACLEKGYPLPDAIEAAENFIASYFDDAESGNIESWTEHEDSLQRYFDYWETLDESEKKDLVLDAIRGAESHPN